MIKMPKGEYLAEHARLAKVLKEAKTTAAAKELAKQRKEVDVAMRKLNKKHGEAVKGPYMMKGLEY